jgi:N,N'-diacetyllegionaminate synthase
MGKTIIIAEIGVNHNADFNLAVKMIQAAAESGADIIKFQTGILELVQTNTAPKAVYQVASTGNPEESQQDMCKKFTFPHEVFPLLKKEVEKRGKKFMSTAFDLKSLAFLFDMGEVTCKIPSGEITNLPYLRAIAKISNEVYISTGMANMNEVEDAINVLLNEGKKKDQITVLQCNTEYPTPMIDVHLNAMVMMGKKLGLKYGYSDHTFGIEIPIAAVAMGATLIEKHFTTDRSLPGPDQKASLIPSEFKAMVDAIRNVELALGRSEKMTTESEEKNKIVARRSIFSSRDIKAGEILSMDNLVMLRPETGISPMFVDDFIGKSIKKDIPKHMALMWEHIE